jgi:Stage II sporulation protein E (SpoIIE)
MRVYLAPKVLVIDEVGYPSAGRSGSHNFLPVGECKVRTREHQQSYDQCQLRLSPGDLVLLFTDGIVDAENPTGQPFDLDQLRNAFAGAAHGTAREVLTAIRSAFQSHQKDTHPKDDQTLFVLRAI